MFEKVLVPTDFSQPSEAAVSFIKNISGVGEIVLLHVVSKGETSESIESSVKKTTDMLNVMNRTLSKDGLKVSTKVAIGDPVERIRSVADEEDVSLIAMSSVGKNTLKTGQIGSRTYDVANTSNRPVLVLRMTPVFEVSA